MPHRVEVMERHPLGSQAFVPMRPCRFLVLAAEGKYAPDPASLRLFLGDGMQGVNYARNTWHHYQMVLDEEADFIVVDRGGPGNNLDEVDLTHLEIIVNAP
jgi:ureidoglycolate lyase